MVQYVGTALQKRWDGIAFSVVIVMTKFGMRAGDPVQYQVLRTPGQGSPWPMIGRQGCTLVGKASLKSVEVFGGRPQPTVGSTGD